MLTAIIQKIWKKKPVEIEEPKQTKNQEPSKDEQIERLEKEAEEIILKKLYTNTPESIERIKHEIKSLKNEVLDKYLELTLAEPQSGYGRALCNTLKKHNQYFALFETEAGKYDLFLGRIQKQEKRSKSNNISTHTSYFFSVDPIIDRRTKKDWLKFTWGEDIVLNSKKYGALSEKAWEAKQKGDLSDPELRKFIEKRKNIKKNKFISEYSLRLMNNQHKIIIQQRLDSNKKLVEFMKKRFYSYYEFLKTGKRQKGYEEKDLPRLNEEVMEIAREIDDNDLESGLKFYYEKGNMSAGEDNMNRYFIKFHQFISMWLTDGPFKKSMTKLEGEVSSVSLQKLDKFLKDESFELRNGDFVDYNFFSLGEPIIQDYEGYYTHGKISHYWAYANYAPNIIVEFNKRIKKRARRDIRLFLKVEKGSPCFEQLDLDDKLTYLALKRKQEGARQYYPTSKKMLQSVEQLHSRIIRTHEEAHHTPANRNTNQSWRRERHSIIDELLYSDPQMALSHCAGSAFAEEKDLDQIYIKACRSILSSYVKTIKQAQTEGRFEHIAIEGDTLKEQVKNFYLLNPIEIETLAGTIKTFG